MLSSLVVDINCEINTVFKLKITKFFSEYILQISKNDIPITLHKFDKGSLFDFIHLFLKDIWYFTIKIYILTSEIVLLYKKFYTWQSMYLYLFEIFNIFSSINKQQSDSVYKQVMIEETNNVLSQKFPVEVLERISEYFYTDF